MGDMKWIALLLLVAAGCSESPTPAPPPRALTEPDVRRIAAEVTATRIASERATASAAALREASAREAATKAEQKQDAEVVLSVDEDERIIAEALLNREELEYLPEAKVALESEDLWQCGTKAVSFASNSFAAPLLRESLIACAKRTTAPIPMTDDEKIRAAARLDLAQQFDVFKLLKRLQANEAVSRHALSQGPPPHLNTSRNVQPGLPVLMSTVLTCIFNWMPSACCSTLPMISPSSGSTSSHHSSVCLPANNRVRYASGKRCLASQQR